MKRGCSKKGSLFAFQADKKKKRTFEATSFFQPKFNGLGTGYDSYGNPF